LEIIITATAAATAGVVPATKEAPVTHFTSKNKSNHFLGTKTVTAAATSTLLTRPSSFGRKTTGTGTRTTTGVASRTTTTARTTSIATPATVATVTTVAPTTVLRLQR